MKNSMRNSNFSRLRNRRIQNETGQASIEMILLAAVSIVTILGLVYRFNTAFKAYTVNLYGNYYRCLLETGALPGTGSICSAQAPSFSASNGKTKARFTTEGFTGGGGSGGGNPGGGGSGTGGGTTGGNGNNPNGSGGNGSGGNGSGGGGGGSGNKTAKSGSGSGKDGGETSGPGDDAVPTGDESSGRANVGKVKNRNSRAVATTLGRATQVNRGGEKAEAEAGLSVEEGSLGSRSRLDSELRRGRTKMDFEMEGSEYKRESSAGIGPSSAVKKVSEDEGDDNLRPRKATEKPTAEKKADINENGEGFQFGKIFRIFLIFAIIVGIVVFLGGQVLQISKSGDK